MATITKSEIVQGLHRGEFILHYQPKASLLTNRIVGAEALARWRRPDGRTQPPDQGTDAAASDQAAGGSRRQGPRQGIVGILQCIRPRSLGCRPYASHPARHCAPASVAGAFELEIAETQPLEGGERMLANVQELAKAGVGLAMDDYGIGYSSMDTLSQWPFTTIKLDQGVVGRMLSSAMSSA